MIKYDKGTVFNSGCEWIVNTVNCKGVMGAGLALEFRLRYPKMFKVYEAACKDGQIKPGVLQYYYSDEIKILNFPTKDDYSGDSKVDYITKGLASFKNTYKEHHITSIAFSKLGCGKGNLHWDVEENIQAIMHEYLDDLEDIEITICLDEEEAMGKEKEMLDAFFTCDMATTKHELKLRDNTYKILCDRQKKGGKTRFSNLLKVKGITPSTYEQLFEYFYNEKYKGDLMWVLNNA